MFFLSEIEHKLRLPPHLLDRPLDQGIRGQLESIFLDKVIDKLGLCVSVYDIKSIDGGFILHNEGQPTYTVVFRMIIFRPVVGEIIAGRVKESNAQGVRVSLGFFEDIKIPAFLFPQPSQFGPVPETPGLSAWVWQFNGENFVLYEGDKIRFRVANVNFPPIPLEQEDGAKPFAPMVVTGSIDVDGLGGFGWW